MLMELQVGGALGVTGATTLSDTLQVNAGANIKGDLSLGGNLFIDNITEINQTVTRINDQVHIENYLHVEEELVVYHTLSVSDNVWFDNNLSVSKDITAGNNIDALNLISDYIFTNEDIIVGGYLSVGQYAC